MGSGGRSSLVTGGAGFIGSHLTEELLARGRAVTILDDLSTGTLANIRHLLPRPDVRFVLGSVLDEALVDELMSEASEVFHLAAAVGVRLIVEDPLASLTTNIRGSENVLAAANARGAKVLVTSSSEIYGKNASDRLREEDDRILGSPLKSRWSYSEAKAIDEILAFTYWKEKGLPAVIVRLFNTVGPRQSGTYGMVIPRFVRQAIRGEAITVYGTGDQTRCFCFVADVVKALVDLLDQPSAYGKVFNVGGQQEISMTELAEMIVRLTGSDSKIKYITYEEAYEEGFEDMPRRVPDITRAQNAIGFSPIVDLENIVRSVIQEHQGGKRS